MYVNTWPFFEEKKILQRNEEGKKYSAEHLEGKKYPAHQIARKFLPTKNHPPPRQELNDRPLTNILCVPYYLVDDRVSANFTFQLLR